MQRSVFLFLVSLVYGVLGILLMVSPETFVNFYGVEIMMDGTQLGILLGATFAGLAMIYWLSRAWQESPAVSAVLWGGAAHNLLMMFFSLSFTFTEQWNPLGWIAVAAHAGLTAGFALYAQASDVE
jgi:hypothetical protein